jgi:hypothetical protein
MTVLKAVSLLVLTSVGGCTSLSTSLMRPTPANTAVTGVTYSLPVLQFDIKVTRTLGQCFKPQASGGGTAPVPELKFTVKAEATSKLVAGETYVVDYEKLAGFTKTSSFGFETYENGTLKSLNAIAEDRSAAIIGDVVKTAINVAKIATGIPGGNQAAGNGISKQMLVCADGTQALLDTLRLAIAELKLGNVELAKRTASVTALTDKLKLGTLNEKGKARLEAALNSLGEQATDVSERQSFVDQATAALTVTTTRRVPKSAGLATGYLTLTGRDLAKVAALLKRIPLVAGPNAGNECNLEKFEECASEMLQAQWVIESGTTATKVTNDGAGNVETAVRRDAAQPITAENARKGLFVRPPSPGRLLICRTSEELDTCEESVPELLFSSTDLLVPQLGQLLFLPFENGAFQNNSLSVTLRENGGIEKFDYKELKARGELLAAAAAGASQQAVAFADARRNADAADVASTAASLKAQRDAELSALQFEINRIGKEDELEKLAQPPEISALDTVKAETAQAIANTSRYQALLAEKRARAELDNER